MAVCFGRANRLACGGIIADYDAQSEVEPELVLR
jgi:hypothetical protein